MGPVQNTAGLVTEHLLWALSTVCFSRSRRNLQSISQGSCLTLGSARCWGCCRVLGTQGCSQGTPSPAPCAGAAWPPLCPLVSSEAGTADAGNVRAVFVVLNGGERKLLCWVYNVNNRTKYSPTNGISHSCGAWVVVGTCCIKVPFTEQEERAEMMWDGAGRGGEGHYLDLCVPWQRPQPKGMAEQYCSLGPGPRVGKHWLKVVPVQSESALRSVFAVSFHPKEAYW